MSPSDTSTTSPLLGVYRIPPRLFVKGEGAHLIDEDGNRFLDFTSGIAVNALGHGSPVVGGAVRSALETGLIHTSNLFRTRPAELLAERLTELTGMDRAFFCNSGGEGVEGALKFSRRWARAEGGPEKHGVAALRGSFHGRLFGSLAVTDRPKYQAPFEPLMPGAHFLDPADLETDLAALDPGSLSAVIVEPIQGEGGVRPLPSELLVRLRRWTEEHRVLLILDEVQCGLGRTGTFLAHEPSGIHPDLLVLAKPLAGGLPMGAVLMTEEVAGAVQPGDHGTTFGGGPLVSTVALAVVEALSDPHFLAEVGRLGGVLQTLLEGIRVRHPERVRELRGRGLIWGMELTGEAAPVVEEAREQGLLLVGAGPNVVRLLPPLNVQEEELRQAAEILESALETLPA